MKHLLIILLFLPAVSSAKTIFEPNINLSTGSFSGKVSDSPFLSTGTEIQNDYTSFAAGVRYGITRRYLHLTAVAEAHYVNVSSDQDNIDTESEFMSSFGLGIGYEWNIPLRTYIILGFPFSAIELTYFVTDTIVAGIRYNQMSLDFAGAELDVNTIGVTVSFPIEFNYPDYWWRKNDWD